MIWTKSRGKKKMKISYVLKTLIFVFVALAATIIGFYSTNAIHKQLVIPHAPEFAIDNVAQATIQPMFTRPVRLEIEIKDDLDQPNGKILEVEFDYEPVFLKPVDTNGDRALIHMQVRPGKYIIRWKVENDKRFWPRITTYEKKITVDKTSLWKHVLIKGRKIEVS